MHSSLYRLMAGQNIKKNKRTYLPYMIAAVGVIALYYIFNSLPFYPGLEKVRGGQSVKMLMRMGTMVMAMFSVIFLFYTNSFLMKQRKKELGLYCVLGMEKRHVARVLVYETLITAAVGLLGGIFFGVLFSKLCYILLLKIMGSSVQLGFIIPLTSVQNTVLFFGAIFAATLIYNISQLHLVNPIELLNSQNAGEKEPKTKWFQAIAGVITMGLGYYLAITTGSPVKAMTTFVIAVLLVMAGTYLLFSAGSIAFLKAMKKRKGYYYQTKHFVSVSGLIYRMKQNAVGLANICILSTAVLITLSTTVCIYVGLEDTLRSRYGTSVTFSSQHLTGEQQKDVVKKVEDTLEKYHQTPTEVRELKLWENVYTRDGEKFTAHKYDSMDFSQVVDLQIMDASIYEELSGEKLTLNDGEACIFALQKDYDSTQLNLSGNVFQIVKTFSDFPDYQSSFEAMLESYILIVKDRDTVAKISDAYNKEIGKTEEFAYGYNYGVELDCDAETQIAITKDLQKQMKEVPYDSTVDGIEIERGDFLAIHGGLLFVGIFLGMAFLLAAVLIIYYKQISEGFEDKKRFEIMCKVGMGEHEVNKSIHSQILMVFSLPIILAGIHMVAAYPCIRKILVMFGLMNQKVIITSNVITYLVFVVIYCMVYAFTARTYIGIVRSEQ